MPSRRPESQQGPGSWAPVSDQGMAWNNAHPCPFLQAWQALGGRGRRAGGSVPEAPWPCPSRPGLTGPSCWSSSSRTHSCRASTVEPGAQERTSGKFSPLPPQSRGPARRDATSSPMLTPTGGNESDSARGGRLVGGEGTGGSPLGLEGLVTLCQVNSWKPRPGVCIDPRGWGARLGGPVSTPGATGSLTRLHPLL